MFLDSPLFTSSAPFKLQSRMVYSDKALVADLARLADAWSELQATRDREAVYSFLLPVFDLVQVWAAEGQSDRNARRALSQRGIRAPTIVEPFVAVITAAVHPLVLDKRQLSKWCRALRYADAVKRPREPLATFIKRRGGINACATGYSRRLGRGP